MSLRFKHAVQQARPGENIVIRSKHALTVKVLYVHPTLKPGWGSLEHLQVAVRGNEMVSVATSGIFGLKFQHP